ncbi:FAD-dependent monooxygenase [Agromyces bauzanensis]
MTALKVLISGSGIAGPALGLWLGRAGHDVTIVERDMEARTGGQAVDVRGAARTVLERMGLMADVIAAGLHEAGFAYVGRRGDVDVRVPVTAFGGDGIVAEVEIFRGALSEILRDAALAHVTERRGDSITSLVQHERGVRVAFAHGEEQEFDLVVGAEGTRSQVRRLAFDAPTAVRPIGAIMSYFSTPLSAPERGWFHMHSAPGRRMAAVRPNLDGGTTALLSFATGAGAAAAARGAVLPRTLADQHALLRSVFTGVGWLAPKLLDAMPHASDFHVDELAQVRLGGWSRGRIVLVGDAAHSPSPLTGMGTSLALVGAYVLAGELTRAAGDHRIAFARYEQVMRDYVRRGQQLPPGGVDGFLPRTRLAIGARNASMRAMTSPPLSRLMSRVFSQSDGFDLPDYGRP